ncbi:MAG: STAS domain-containing protein [Pseudonocardiaceae bacterium]
MLDHLCQDSGRLESHTHVERATQHRAQFKAHPIEHGCAGVDDGVSQMASRSANLLFEAHFRGRILVVRPVGDLLPETYERLRDGLLKYAAEEPTAMVLDLAGMRAGIASLLTVFPTVRDRISDWPGVPLVLAAARPPLGTLLDFSAASRLVPTYRTVSEALEYLNAAPPRRRCQRELPCEPASARLARQLVEQTCHEWEIPGMVAAAAVVATELTDNMVYHARSPGWLRLELRSNMLTIAVADADPRPPQLRVPGLRAAGGRGLVLVDKLSKSWGTASRPPEGKVVWAVLTVASRMRTPAHASRVQPASPSSAARCS